METSTAAFQQPRNKSLNENLASKRSTTKEGKTRSDLQWLLGTRHGFAHGRVLRCCKNELSWISLLDVRPSTRLAGKVDITRTLSSLNSVPKQTQSRACRINSKCSTLRVVYSTAFCRIGEFLPSVCSISTVSEKHSRKPRVCCKSVDQCSSLQLCN